jgi:hypothetical protein
MADTGKPGEEEGPGKRAEYKAYPKTKRHEQGVVGLCEKNRRKKSERWAAAPFLYLAKAMAGLCTRLS